MHIKPGSASTTSVSDNRLLQAAVAPDALVSVPQQNGPRRPRPGAASAPPNQRVENLADDTKLVGGPSSNPGSGPASPKITHQVRGLNLLDEVVRDA